MCGSPLHLVIQSWAARRISLHYRWNCSFRDYCVTDILLQGYREECEVNVLLWTVLFLHSSVTHKHINVRPRGVGCFVAHGRWGDNTERGVGNRARSCVFAPWPVSGPPGICHETRQQLLLLWGNMFLLTTTERMTDSRLLGYNAGEASRRGRSISCLCIFLLCYLYPDKSISVALWSKAVCCVFYADPYAKELKWGSQDSVCMCVTLSRISSTSMPGQKGHSICHPLKNTFPMRCFVFRSIVWRMCFVHTPYSAPAGVT